MRRLAGLMLGVAAALSGCGGDGGGGTPTPTPTPASTYAVGGAVAGLAGGGLVLKNGADSLAVAADGRFTFPTKLANGAAYAVTVGAQPSGQTCTVTGGSGTIAGADVTTVAVACAASASIYAYAAVTHAQADADGLIQYLAFDAATGRLSLAGTVPTDEPESYVGNVVPTADGKQLLVATSTRIPPGHADTRDDLVLYGLSAATGAPSRSRLIASPGGVDLVHPNGEDVYAQTFSSLSHYSLATGAEQGQSLALGENIGFSSAISPDGKFLFVPDSGQDNGGQPFVGVVSLANPAHPALLGKTTVPIRPNAVTISPDGTLLYVAPIYATLDPPQPGLVFKVDTGGGLTRLGTFPAPSGSRTGAITPSGRQLYLASSADDLVQGYRLDAAGRITKIGAGVTVPDAFRVVLGPDGRYLYVLSVPDDGSAGAIYGFAIRPNGALAPVPGSPFRTGERILNLAFARPNG